MANTVEIIITAVDKTKQVFNNVGASVKSYGDKISAVTKAVTGFDAATLASTVGIGIIVSKYRQAIEQLGDYAKQVRDVSRAIGGTPEDVSKLIQAADDAQVSVESLTTALVWGAKNGVDVTISGMSKLAEQYNAIQDPLERVKFLMDTFGRSGAGMGELLELGADGIKKAGDEAERFGRILTSDDLKNTEDFRLAVDGLNDSFSKMKDQLALGVIPTLTLLANTMTPLLNAYNDFKSILDKIPPELQILTVVFQGMVNPIKAVIGPVYYLIDAFKQLLFWIKQYNGATGGAGGSMYTTWQGNDITPKAAGGPVMANTPYIVGERGPEIFMPKGSGNIVPNNQIGGMSLDYDRMADALVQALQRSSLVR